MRAGHQDADIFGGYKDGTGLDSFVALSLGWDHVAEHEWGIEDLLSDFKCNTEKQGLAAYKINKLSENFVSGPVLDIDYCGEKIDLWVISNAEYIKDHPDRVKDYMEHKFHDDELDIDFWSAWDSRKFVLAIKQGSISDTRSMQLYTMLHKAFLKKDIAIFTSGTKDPFAGQGLMLAIYSRIPKQVLSESKKEAAEKGVMARRMANSKAIKAREDKIAEWKAANLNCSTPWDAIFLGDPSAHGLDLKFWLNPNHQNQLNAAWITESDVMDWVNGKVGKVIKSQALWDELLWECTRVSYRSSLIGFNLHRFNRYPAMYKRPKGDNYPDGWTPGSNMPKALDKNKKLTPEFVKYVEQHIKQLMIRDLEEQFESQHRGDLSKLNEITHVRTDVAERVSGFFEALRLLGYETRPGASNTPAVRENFSWWKELLEEESFWEFWIKLGVAYEPWVKNGYTEVSRELWHMYKKHGWKDEHGLAVLDEILANDTVPVSEED
jgi:hypothetical protein